MITTTFDPDLPLVHIRYGRMSREEQNPRSPDQQFDEIDRTKRKHGRDNWVHVRDYRDDGISGRYKRKRPGFRQMLDEIRSGVLKIDAILVDTIERFARFEDLPAIRNELRKKFGVLILTADTGFADPTSTVGTVYTAVESVRSTSAAAQKAHDVLRGKIDAAQRKRWPGGPPPTGFLLAARTETITRRNGKSLENAYHVLEPDPATAEIPRRIYQLAFDHGLGRTRITRTLNADAEFVARFGKLNVSLVGSILGNQIYKGVYRFNYHATDIADDCRIIQKKDPADVIYVDDFCEGIVPREIVDKVHADLRKRSERMLQLRAAKCEMDDKQVKPLNPGLILVNPLSGLVRCATCNACMVVCTSGAKCDGDRRYGYYRCPSAHDDRCPNKVSVRRDWLWEVVIARLREVLFPLASAGEDMCPEWLPELINEVRSALAVRLEQEQDRRPMLVKESSEIDRKIAGWTATLSNLELSPLARTHLEQELGQALLRKQEIAVDLELLENGKKHVAEVLDVQMAIDRLRRLDQVLSAGNPSDINEELSRHIESIVVEPSSRVIMRTSRLGIFEGAIGILGGAGTPEEHKADGETGGFRVRPRALSRRRTTGPVETSTLAKASGIIEVAAKLPDRWIDEAIFHMPELKSWPEEHAEEVFRRRQAAKLSYAKLGTEFNVSAPTARAAVQHYLAAHPEAKDEVNLTRGRKGRS
jgi:DNA invertase Pin-like site-specific DNA recombinase